MPKRPSSPDGPPRSAEPTRSHKKGPIRPALPVSSDNGANPLVPDDPFAFEPVLPPPAVPAAAEAPAAPTPTPPAPTPPTPTHQKVPSSETIPGPGPISRPVPRPSALLPPPVEATPRPIQVVDDDEDLGPQRRGISLIGCTVLGLGAVGVGLTCAGIFAYHEELLKVLAPVSAPTVTRPAPTPATPVSIPKAPSADVDKQEVEAVRERIGREWENIGIAVNANTDLTKIYKAANNAEGSITITCRGGKVVPNETLLKHLTDQPLPIWSRNDSGQLVVTNFKAEVLDEPKTVCQVYARDGQLTHFLQR